MSKIIESNYQGKYNTSTRTPLSKEDIKVDLSFGPIDLLMGSYGSCMLGTVDFYARKKVLKSMALRVKSLTKCLLKVEKSVLSM